MKPLRAVVPALLLASVAVAAGPAEATGPVISDADHGYRLAVHPRTTGFVLRLDQTYSGASELFQLSCGKHRDGKRNLNMGEAPITPARTLRGGLFHWNAKKRFCDLTATAAGTSDPVLVASFHLKVRR